MYKSPWQQFTVQSVWGCIARSWDCSPATIQTSKWSAVKSNHFLKVIWTRSSTRDWRETINQVHLASEHLRKPSPRPLNYSISSAKRIISLKSTLSCYLWAEPPKPVRPSARVQMNATPRRPFPTSSASWRDVRFPFPWSDQRRQTCQFWIIFWCSSAMKSLSRRRDPFPSFWMPNWDKAGWFACRRVSWSVLAVAIPFPIHCRIRCLLPLALQDQHHQLHRETFPKPN